jgi:hypothetical protein
MYLLIIGAPRSGTTLLASMIGAHSDVAMLIEDRTFAIKKLTGKKVLSNKLCIPHQTEIKKKASLFSRYMQKIGFLKNYPTSKFSIEDYLQLEDLKILSIIRNGNDIIDSIMKRGKKTQQIALKRWSRSIEMILYLSNNYPLQTAIISYEDLVTQPEKMLKKISLFLDIKFQPQMLEGYKYNILYPNESGIDKTRAFRTKMETENNIIAAHANTLEMYRQLLQSKINL